MEHNSSQIGDELDNSQTMQSIPYTIKDIESLETKQQGAGKMLMDSHLLPVDIANIRTLEPLDVADLDGNMQQVEGPSLVTTLDTVVNSATFHNPAVTEIQCMPMMDAHGVQAASTGTELISSQYLNNVPMQYTLDSSSLLTSSINSADNMQIILEIYFDESGNVINNMSDVLHVEQTAVDNPSDVQQ